MRLFVLLLLAALLVPSAARASSSTNLVISQIFAGGGNSGAPLQNDFVELLNRGSTTIDLSGWTVQYAPATGTSWQVATLTGSVGPGRYYLVQLASAGQVGAALPAPDATGTLSLAATGGKVALVQGTAALTCGATAGTCSAVPSVDDFVGYGSATDYEGGGPAPALDNVNGAMRLGAGCTDTDSSANDFTAVAPLPRNTASTAAGCASPPSPAQSATVDVDIEPLISVTLSRAALSFGQATAGSTPASLSESVTVKSNRSTGYSLSVHRSAFSPSDLPLAVSSSAPAGAQLGLPSGGALTPIPVTPSADLLVGTTSAASPAAGDVWPASVGFSAPLPAVAPGHYTATVTFTVVGR